MFTVYSLQLWVIKSRQFHVNLYVLVCGMNLEDMEENFCILTQGEHLVWKRCEPLWQIGHLCSEGELKCQRNGCHMLIDR